MERRYSQTEKEALALVWACERFSMYVSRQSFAVKSGGRAWIRRLSSYATSFMAVR